MARINVEDDLFKDQRFIDLILELRGLEPALGAVVHCWQVAQEFWKHSDNGIPKTEWKKQKLCDALVSCGLVEDCGDFLLVRGSADHFAWIRQKVKAGEKGGSQSKKSPLKIKEENSKRKQAQESAEERSEPSYSSSLSFSLSNTNTEEPSGGELAVAPPTPPAKVPKKSRYTEEHSAKAQAFVAEYVKAYGVRFPQCRPEDLHDGKTRGQIMIWIKDYPLERACQLIQVYFQMETKWFGTKGYDFITFKNNLNKIGQALDTGKDPDGNSVDWSKVFGEGGLDAVG